MTKLHLAILTAATIFLAGCGTLYKSNTTQTTSTPPVVSDAGVPEAVKQFIPLHYVIFKSVADDLNGDKRDDIALVLKHEDEDSEGIDTSANDFPSRLLIVLAQQADRTYKKIGYSERAILCKDCGGAFGEPLDNISIEKGILMITHYGGSRFRWGYTHTFRWQNGGMYLIGKNIYQLDDVLLFDETKDYNLVTGDFEHSWGTPPNYETNQDYSDEDKATIKKFDRPTEHTKIPVKPLIHLEDFNINNEME